MNNTSYINQESIRIFSVDDTDSYRSDFITSDPIEYVLNTGRILPRHRFNMANISNSTYTTASTTASTFTSTSPSTSIYDEFIRLNGNEYIKNTYFPTWREVISTEKLNANCITAEKINNMKISQIFHEDIEPKVLDKPATKVKTVPKEVGPIQLELF